MNDQYNYRSMVKINYKNNKYEIFENKYNKKAILRINENGQYCYPTVQELIEVYLIINTHNASALGIEDNRRKVYKFVPKVIVGTTATLITASILAGCINTDVKPTNQYELSSVTAYEQSYEEQTNDYVFDPAEFEDILTPVDDEHDYHWGTDYMNSEYTTMITCHDSSGYDQIFETVNPSYDELCKKVDANENISAKYKQFIKDYLNDWLTKWPDSDFTLFYYNLDSLKIVELSEKEIQEKAISSTSVACYVNGENTIYINENIDISSKANDDYIVLGHELTHVAKRINTVSKDGKQVKICFSEYRAPGTYSEEAIITLAMYDLQGMNNTSVYYTLPCNYYRIILDCLGDEYTTEDFMNRSVNYLGEKMGEYTGDSTEYAFYILKKIGYQYEIKNNIYVSYDIDSFQDVYDYITKMYCIKYLSPDMTSEEAEEVFDNLVTMMTINLDKVKQNNYDEINESCFRDKFEEICSEYGIQLESQLRGR